jgi:hypothetical protein
MVNLILGYAPVSTTPYTNPKAASLAHESRAIRGRLHGVVGLRLVNRFSPLVHSDLVVTVVGKNLRLFLP